MIVDSVIALRGINKRFGAVEANCGVDLDVGKGTVHALVGENGAGKSTLMKIAYGHIRADGGEIHIKSQAVERRRYTPRQAIARGVGMVHQHFMLVGSLTVVENVVLGREPRGRAGLLDLRRAAAELAVLSNRFGLDVDAWARVDTLSVGQQQRVEIIKVLWQGSDILILDEPTAVLTPAEVRDLFAVLRSLVDEGMTIVLITHKLDEVVAIADRVTVMRRGQVVCELEGEQISAEEIARAMVGRPLLMSVDRTPASPGEVVLALADVVVHRGRGVPALERVSLAVRAGEIVGVAGVEGNGQTELIEAIAGLRKVAAGSIRVAGTEVGARSVRQRRQVGVAHVPEDRQRRGLVLDYSVADNLVLGHHRGFGTRFGLDRGAIAAHARALIKGADIRPADGDAAIATLSGGNQQKAVMARELAADPLHLLLAAQPTRGVDIGAIELIHRRLIAARDSGLAVLVVSAELSELVAIADRVVVLYRGEIVATLDRDRLDQDDAIEYMGQLMTGAVEGVG